MNLNVVDLIVLMLGVVRTLMQICGNSVKFVD